MPKPIEYTEQSAERYFPRAPLEKIIGTDEGKRSTKAWIPTFEQALALSILDEFAGDDGSFLKILRRFEERQWDQNNVPEDKRVYRDWSGPKRYGNLHTAILNHSISVDGKSLKVVTRHDELRQKAEALAKESAQKADE